MESKAPFDQVYVGELQLMKMVFESPWKLSDLEEILCVWNGTN